VYQDGLWPREPIKRRECEVAEEAVHMVDIHAELEMRYLISSSKEYDVEMKHRGM
jgi:hypothetical protein